MRRTHAFAASAERSLQATLAPYLASASAIPLPMFGPAPVTSATFPASEMSTSLPLLASLAGALRAGFGRQSSDLGPATASGPANAVPVIRVPPGSGHTIYDTF